jgi:hypothetical protein
MVKNAMVVKHRVGRKEGRKEGGKEGRASRDFPVQNIQSVGIFQCKIFSQ